MIRTRKAPARFLSAMLCLVLMLGLLPMTAFAEGTREEVDTIKATAIINVPSYGEPTNYPAFTVTEGSPAHIATMMTHWEKKNTVTGKWDNVYSGDTFTEGTWRLSVQVRIDDEGGKTHKLSAKPRFFVNEVEWQIKSGPLFDDPHFVSLAYFHSQEYEVTSSTLPQMYDITVKNGVAKNVSYIDITKAKPGDKVVLLANDRRDEGLAFEKWVVTGATVDAENNMTAKFIMPEGNVTAEATYIPCDISIKAVKLTLGNYAVGKKASDISVKIITPDVVDFSYGDTYCCYDEDGVALGGSYVLCYLEGETVKRLGADELIKEGVEYFLEVHIKPDEGYTFLGLEEENVTLDGTAGVAMFMRPNNAVYSFLLKPLKTVDLTLDNYAVGNKAGDISVEITTPGVLFSGSGEGSGEYNQGYQIAIPDGEGIDGTITVRFLGPDEKLEAGADYDLFVFVKAADGSTLKDLAAANAKLDGKAAEAVDLLSDGVTAVIIFKLTPLEASHTHTYTANEKKPEALKTAGTCKDKAIYLRSCEVCGKVAPSEAWGTFYGDLDPNNHAGGTTTVNASEPDHKNQVDGYTGNTKCLGCNEIIAYGTSIPAGAHTPSSTWSSDGDYHWKTCSVAGCGVIIDGSKAAHTSTGANVATCQHKAVCDACNVEYGEKAAHNPASGWTSDASGHWHACQTAGCTEKLGFAAHTPDREAATETDPIKCSECDYIITPALGHTHHMTPVAANPATCTTDGNKAYYVCSGCSKWFEDATGSVEITDHSSVVLGKLGHDWVAANCTTPKTCSRCDATEGNALGHDFADVWSSDASGHWHACSRCDAKDGEAAHTPDREAATETDPIKCTECDYIITAALGHTHSLTKVEANAPTCTEDGNIEYYTCSGCSKLFADATGNVEITADKTVDKATGHTYEWVIDKEATATEKGSKHEECKVCHDKKAAVEIPATGTPTDPTKPENPDSPQTGDNSMMGLWIALLFVSGVGVVGTTIYSRKKKYSVK